ncbi:MAG: DUF4402 domain-containing protein [Sphingomicrobium sp.]
MRLTLGIAALAATMAVASPAFAQTVTANAQAEARGVVLLPLTLTKTSDLDFGTVIADQLAAGTVSIDADTGARSVTGAVLGVPGYPGSRGLFQGAGTALQVVNLTLNAPTVLTSGPNTINVLAFDVDQGGLLARTIDATTAFEVGVGGTFEITAAQPNGLYTAQFDLTAEYQ